ncbi:TetR/AcrR family transcriptional regulator [Lentzea jiangxiensis]|uniref:DNA-binding transcriptional regulator, AcrR family n=1 Tax=Lentzea jiangxiensis TaxID=641025 RepID=A0A1H0W0X9_9PSEU|nr:TetR/AcrR family transcriptional regulator [Lentzea jiangxiensis]SDP84397.1 DNA-binding transcriptional regulator, AcrR family [Lentzea jiangxiensis]
MAERSAGRPRDPEADTAILTAAFELFLERGLDGTSIEQVAKRAGVTRATVYRRFATKEDLLFSVIELPRTVAALDPERMAVAPPEETLKGWAALLSNGQSVQLLRRIIGTSADNFELMRRYWELFIAPRRAVLKDVVRSGFPPGTDLDVVVDMAAGALFYRALTRPEHNTPEELETYLHKVLLQLGYHL